MRIPKVKRPIDNMSNEEIEQAKAELIKVCGPNIVNQIIDYSKGNNGRVNLQQKTGQIVKLQFYNLLY